MTRGDFAVWIHDDGGTILIRARVGEDLVSLTVRRREVDYHVGDLLGEVYWNGGRHKGFGTVLVNTAIRYLQRLDDRRRPTVAADLHQGALDQPDWEPERRLFAQRFGVEVAGDTVSANLRSLAPVPGRAVLGRYPSDIPLEEFAQCTHAEHPRD